MSGVDLDLDGSEDLNGSGFPSQKVGRELGLDGLEEEGDVDTCERERSEKWMFSSGTRGKLRAGASERDSRPNPIPSSMANILVTSLASRKR